MPQMYKEGTRPANVDRDQIKAFEAAGWSLEQPKAKEVKEPVKTGDQK